MTTLDATADALRNEMEAINDARDVALERSRQLVRVCARAIRAIHREEWATAENLIAEAADAAGELVADLADYPDLLFAGYTQDALKEYVEAHLTYAFVHDQPLRTAESLGVTAAVWLNGLAEAATELRRRILDIIRHGHDAEAERLLAIMDDIYTTLVTFDFSDSITRGLRRRTDTLRAVLERTRGDMSTSLRQAQLQRALERLEARLSDDGVA